MDYVKGRLEIVQVSVSTYQIWAKPKPNRKAILVASNLNEDDAKELVRRWNAFEKGGMVDELRVACDIGLDATNAILEIDIKLNSKNKKKASKRPYSLSKLPSLRVKDSL